jgi:hypothetical protein
MTCHNETTLNLIPPFHQATLGKIFFIDDEENLLRCVTKEAIPFKLFRFNVESFYIFQCQSSGCRKTSLKEAGWQAFYSWIRYGTRQGNSSLLKYLSIVTKVV